VISSYNRDTYLSTHEATNDRVRPLPFVGESQRELLEELSCFTPDHTTGGDGKRSEVLALFETGLQVLLLLFSLLRGKDFVGVSNRLVIRNDNTKDTCCTLPLYDSSTVNTNCSEEIQV
jgi:hypothetical protein